MKILRHHSGASLKWRVNVHEPGNARDPEERGVRCSKRRRECLADAGKDSFETDTQGKVHTLSSQTVFDR